MDPSGHRAGSLDLLDAVGESGLGQLVRLVSEVRPTADALSAFDRMGSLVELADGEIEIALVALLPRPEGRSAPLLIARVELDENGQAALEASLGHSEFARPYREIEGRQTYSLRSASRERAGEFFEVALIGRELFVANDGSALTEVLRTTEPDNMPMPLRDPAGNPIAPRVGSVGADLVVRELEERLGARDCQLVIDWERVRHRIGFHALVENDRIRELAQAGSDLVVEALGLHTATRLVIGLDEATSKVNGGEGRFLRTALMFDQPEGYSGALVAAEPKSLRSFESDLAQSSAWVSDSIATATLSVDFAEVLSRSSDLPGGEFATHACDTAASVGVIDLPTMFERRFERGVSLQIYRERASESEGDGSVGLAWSLPARSARLAERVVEEIATSITIETTNDSERSIDDSSWNPIVRGSQVVFGSESDQASSRTGDSRSMGTTRGSMRAVLRRLAEVAFGGTGSVPPMVGVAVLREGAIQGVPAQAGAVCLVDGAVRVDWFHPL